MTDDATRIAPPDAPTKEPRRWKTWHLVVASVVALLLGIGVGGAGGETAEDSEEAAAIETTTTTEEEVTTTSQRPTTTTTTAPPETPEMVEGRMAASFEQLRPDFINLLESTGEVETVDLAAFDRDADMVVADVTSLWASPDNQHNGAWSIMRTLAGLWEDEGSGFRDALYAPGFRLVNSGRAYQCSADMMIRLAEARAARSDWEAECA